MQCGPAIGIKAPRQQMDEQRRRCKIGHRCGINRCDEPVAAFVVPLDQFAELGVHAQRSNTTVASPRKVKNPITSVTVVRKMLLASAGS